MASNSSEGLGDDFLEQILAVPSSAYSNANANTNAPPPLQLGMPPLGLNLEQAFFPPLHHHDVILHSNNNNHHLHLHNSTNVNTSSSSTSTSALSAVSHLSLSPLSLIYIVLDLLYLCPVYVLLQDRESVQRTHGLFSPFGPLHLRPTTLPSPPPPPSQLPIRQVISSSTPHIALNFLFLFLGGQGHYCNLPPNIGLPHYVTQ